MINKSQLEESVSAAGAFMGLLTEAANGYTVNTDFFKHGGEVLGQCGQRMNHLVDLFFDVLANTHDTPPAGNPPVFDAATWLMIQNPLNGGQSPFYIVVPAQDSNGDAPVSGQIGLGALLGSNYPGSHFAAEVYIYIPLFNYSASGTSFLLGQNEASLQVGLNISKDDRFYCYLIGEPVISFSGINIAANIFLSDKLPAFKLLFEDLKGTSAPAEYDTLESLRSENLKNLLEIPLLNNDIVQVWLRKNILELLPKNYELSVTLGSLLASAGFIKSNNPVNPLDPFANYALTLDTLPNDPKQIALNFLFGLLNVLNGQPLIKLPGGNIFIAARQDPNDNAADQYGIGVRMEMPLNNGDGTKSTKPSVTLCLGAWLSGETDNDNWMTRSNAPAGLTDGLMVWLINNKKVGGNNQVSFNPGFSLSSIGINITGGAEKPLFSIDGYTLKGAELRATLDAGELLHPSTWTFGFAAKLDQIGFPLVPPGSGDSGDGDNPVAKSLLQSKNDSSSSNAQPGDQSAVNPSFGVAASWYLHGNFDLQLFDANNQADDTVVFPINRKLGPLTCEQIGIGWMSNKGILSILFDGSVMLGPLDISLQGLTVGVPITAPTDLTEYSLDLQGMGISFNAGAVSLTGAFVKIPPADTEKYIEYAGLVAIEAGPFAISALGAYAYLPATAPATGGFASLFIFGVLDAPLGGPEFFFITGIAAGFGYNRAINLPDQNSVPDFPFVAMLEDPTKFGPSSDLTGLLTQIDDYVPPERGEYWLAAGVRFTSFDLIHSTALVSIEFGNALEIGILGTSWVALPPPPSDFKFAFVELAIDIQILPDKGLISVTAILTPNSFVIAPDCHLTGGFAFYVWFGSNPHAGQFVLTVGGYHPRFSAPAYYPQVPRLGFNWNVSSVVVIGGDSYFALTSSAIMAGGGLSIIFHAGPIKAWFIAQMDALVQWAPFQYDLDISISIGVQLKLDLAFFTITITLELGAALEIWGPDMGGKARISVLIISFTIDFGADPPSANATISWSDFTANLLPNKKPVKQKGNSLAIGNTDITPTPAILTITVAGGLQKIWTNETTKTAYWIVRPAGFSFSAQTAFPATALTVSPANGETVQSWNATYDEVDVRPLAAKINSSVMNVELRNEDDNKVYSLLKNFDLETAISTVPAAKWGARVAKKDNGMAGEPEMNGFLTNRLMGFKSITPKAAMLTPNGPNALNIDAAIAFADIVVNLSQEYHLPLDSATKPVGTVPQGEGVQSWSIIETALKDATVTAARTNVFNILIQQFGINPLSNDNLEQSKFAEQPGAYLNGYPLVTFIIEN